MTNALVNTHLLSINPSNFARYEWDLIETCVAFTEEGYESKYDSIDWTKTDCMEGINNIGKEVFNWMQEKDAFKNIYKRIKGFKIEFHTVFTHGYTGNNIEMKVWFDLDSVNRTIKQLAKNPKFVKFLHENYKSYDGFTSFVPNTIEGLLEANTDKVYKIGPVLGFLIQQNMEKAEIDCDFSDNATWEDTYACPFMYDWESSNEAFNLIVFEEKP